MSTLALHSPDPQPGTALAQGRVERARDGICRVRCGTRRFATRIAASCLLMPRAGDEVLLAMLPERAPVVLAVIARDEDLGTLRLPGGARLLGEASTLRLQAARLDVHCAALGLRALEVRACFGRMQAVGREWLGRLGRSLMDLGDSVRRVRGLDESHAAQQRMRVDGRMQLQCGDAGIAARRRVRIDGEHIDLG